MPDDASVPPPPPGGSGSDDWPAQAADAIVKVVGQVRDRTTGTAITAARAVVYGTLACILGTAVLVLASILLVRGLAIAYDELLGLADLDRAGRGVWLAELTVALAFLLAGQVLWRKAHATPSG
jgi:hypothetical protein